MSGTHCPLHHQRAETSISGDAGHTTIKAVRGEITQQLDLTQGEVIGLWQKIGVKYNLAGMRDTAEQLPTQAERDLAHLELLRQSSREQLTRHLMDYTGHHAQFASGTSDLLSRPTDDLLRKHAELHGVSPR
jgi:hypothetical protein